MPTEKRLDIVLVDVDKIIPYWRNPRRNDKTVDWLCEIIPVYGFNVPIVIDHQNVIVKGHARLKAAKRLGMTQVPCIYSDNDDETNKADRIADNKIQEMSYWDLAKLEMEYQRIGNLRFDKLFHPDEIQHVDFIPDTDMGFQATSLEDGFDFSDDDDTPRNYGVGTENAEGSYKDFRGPSELPETDEGETARGDYGDGYSHQGASQEASSVPAGHRVIKTICPYCGKDVLIRL